jgi:hypothetical protein
MPPKKVTETGAAFREYLEKELPTPRARAQFYSDVEKIRSIAKLFSVLEGWRDQSNLPKAEIARRLRKQPPAISRWFSSEDPNPTIKTLIDLCSSMNLHVRVVLEPRKPGSQSSALDVDFKIGEMPSWESARAK